ncbi:MAG: phosphate ABC transporter substrate-binding protein PstS [Firmicutes bacterium]|nr:phosphate ABC transporter substrate-binding protein PstS [Bacillota bacterium]
MQHRLKSIVTAAAATLLVAGCGSTAAKGTAASPSQAAGTGSSVTILETGSTLLYPLFQQWVPAYEAAHPNVHITPAGTGSGTGIAQALAGAVQIGASDAYMSDAQMKPGILNIPLAISAQVVAYNLPGLNQTHLNLSGPVLAGIYTGKIGYWDNPQIRAANPGVSLPHQPIIPVRRNDSSGDSFLFTQYLSKSAPSVWTAGYATSPSWPAVPNEASATGNGGMVEFLKANPYSIAYVGISYLNQLESDHLGYAALQNPASQYVLPTQDNIEAAAKAMVPTTPPDERISLIDAPGASAYPIINYEYAIVKADQPSANMASALKAFLTWAISPQGGNQAKFLDSVHFLPLPSSVVTLSQHQIDEIH